FFLSCLFLFLCLSLFFTLSKEKKSNQKIMNICKQKNEVHQVHFSSLTSSKCSFFLFLCAQSPLFSTKKYKNTKHTKKMNYQAAKQKRHDELIQEWPTLLLLKEPIVLQQKCVNRILDPLLTPDCSIEVHT